MNWSRTLREFVGAGDYELDGVIFAVYGNDLRRPFAIWDDRVVQLADDGTRTVAFGAVWSEPFPKTLEEARTYFFGLPRWQVHPTETFDRMLKGEVRPRDDRAGLFFARQMWPPPEEPYIERHVPGRMLMSHEIRQHLEARKMPALVVAVPAVDSLLQGRRPTMEAQTFARTIDAQFVDGARAYEGLSEAEIRACWLPYDKHWGQRGSDRFAEFMFEVLSDWPEE